MNEKPPVRFDEAWARARAFLEAQPALLAASPVLVRDIYGKIRIALDDRVGKVPTPAEQADLAVRLHSEVQRWSPGAASTFMLASGMFAPDEIFAAPGLLHAGSEGHAFRILDRTIVGTDWLGEPFDDRDAPCRLTFFGIKGGVGRSTAMAVLAWRLSQTGRRVLVVDLDLESPGIGVTLLPESHAPDFGIVDWFVEETVGQADGDLLREMAAQSPLGEGGAEILAVSAGGRQRAGYTYLPKLARVYAEMSGDEDGRIIGFGERLHALVRRLEKVYRPDVVLLDSRAGIHDIAAVTVTRMNATCLLFAINAPQTWNAYRALFEYWQTYFGKAALFRANLKMVAGQVPETETAAYLERFQQRAYNLFAETLYVETPPGEQSEFNFDLTDPDAPHAPLRIHWSRTFQQFDPVHRPGAVTDTQIQAAFGDFVRGVGLIALGEIIE
jgi:hypothetical protein